MIITEFTKFLEEIKYIILNNREFIQLAVDENKRINYITNLESKVKYHFKALEYKEKISQKGFDSACRIKLHFLLIT